MFWKSLTENSNFVYFLKMILRNKASKWIHAIKILKNLIIIIIIIIITIIIIIIIRDTSGNNKESNEMPSKFVIFF